MIHANDQQCFLRLVLAIGILSLSPALFAQDVVLTPQDLLLTAPRTPENSFIVDFGYGGKLRVPKVIMPRSMWPAHPNQVIKSEVIDFTFWYPDMTLTGWTAQIETIFDKSAGHYKPQPNRFKVRINSLFYSPGELGNDSEHQQLWQPRPKLMEANLGDALGKFRHLPSAYPDLDFLATEEAIRKHPKEAMSIVNTEGMTYVNKPLKPYELLMRCSPPDGIQCKGDVYIKKNHYQFQLIFPPEAVGHTDAIIRAISRTIDGWVVK